MKISQITALARQHDVRLGAFGGRGRCKAEDQPDIDKRNIFLLAIYEEAKGTPYPLSISDLAILCELHPHSIAKALNRARDFRSKYQLLQTFKTQINYA